MNKDKLRTFYSLWWEFLKRSEKYETFCSAIRETKHIPSSLKYLPDGRLTPLFNSYTFFGDVFRQTFEDFWQKIEPYVEFEHHPQSCIKVHDPATLKEKFSLAIDYALEELRTRGNLTRFKEDLCLAIFDILGFGDGSVIQVDFFNDKPVKELANLFCKTIKKERMKFFSQPTITERFNKRLRENFVPAKHIHLDPIPQYLQVFDLRKAGKTWLEIAMEIRHPYVLNEQLVPEPQLFNHQVKTDCQRKFRKARQILQNVEEGVFPGNYGDN